MTLELKTKKVTEETATIEMPCFLKKTGSRIIAIFDESDAVEIYVGTEYSYISSGSAEFMMSGVNVLDCEKITEQDFRYNYEKALKQIAIPKKELFVPALNE